MLELLPDFYSDLNLGLTLIQKKIKENGGASSEFFQSFMNMNFNENFADDETLTYLRKYLYRTLLNESGYKYNKSKNFHIFNWKYFLNENKSGLHLDQIKSYSLYKEINSFEEMTKWLRNLSNHNIYSDLHPEILSLVNLIRKRNTSGTSITGTGYISMCCSQHSSNDDFEEKNKGNELLEYIKNGKMVIIDLSGSSPSSQIILMRELANNIFLELKPKK